MALESYAAHISLQPNLLHFCNRKQSLHSYKQFCDLSIKPMLYQYAVKLKSSSLFSEAASMRAVMRNGANMIATEPLNLTHSHKIYHTAPNYFNQHSSDLLVIFRIPGCA